MNGIGAPTKTVQKLALQEDNLQEHQSPGTQYPGAGEALQEAGSSSLGGAVEALGSGAPFPEASALWAGAAALEAATISPVQHYNNASSEWYWQNNGCTTADILNLPLVLTKFG